jgi:uncharacterized protein (TIGR01319 family)
MPTMDLVLLIDFGSTYTKVVAIDLASERLLSRVQAPSTVESDVMVGLHAALDRVRAELGLADLGQARFLASSSAAGGLRLVAIGLVPELTAEAAKRAALGAGAKVLRVFSHHLTRRDLAALEELRPEIVLLAGGTDGGNSEVILYNARALAGTSLTCPILYAGNKDAADEAEDALRAAGKDIVVTENVLPELGRLNVEPARTAIREVFMRRIVEAKGIHRARELVGDILMPTPMAVLQAATLLAEGTADEPGLGDLLVVDVGGATTDVHSVAHGGPSDASWLPRGLPEPYAKRTVEGDLGLRVNAASILEAAGEARIAAAAGLPRERVRVTVERLTQETATVPRTPADYALDVALARAAVEVAVQRHAGTLDTVYTAHGPVTVLLGKDLTTVGTVIGTGGVFARGSDPRAVLAGALFDSANPLSLRPKRPRLVVDRPYILYAVGLLAQVAPGAALRIMKQHLVEV